MDFPEELPNNDAFWPPIFTKKNILFYSAMPVESTSNSNFGRFLELYLLIPQT